MSSERDFQDIKKSIRHRVWESLEKSGFSRFPKPVYGRIPNFVGAERAADILSRQDVFRRADVVFANPDSPQRHVRYIALREGKLVIMATPKLKRGFVIIDPDTLPERFYREACTIKGAFKYGRLTLDLSGIKVDLKVSGSVAVTLKGGRLGKGGGYSDLEYAILRELDVIDDSTPIATTVHELQIVEDIPMLKHDVPVDLIVTPKKAIYVEQRAYPKPKGIYWDILPKEKVESIPLLKLLGVKSGG